MNKVVSFLKSAITDWSLLTWNIVGILLSIYLQNNIFIFASIIGSIIFYFAHREKLKKEAAIERKADNIQEAELFVANIQQNKALQTLPTSLLLDNKEFLFLQEETMIMETRSVRQYQGVSSRVRVMRGFSVGQSRGRSESHKEWRTLDAGRLMITNKKLVFNGTKESRVVPLNKIVEVTAMLDAVEIASSTRNSTMVFPVKNPYIWSTVVKILRSVDNPLALGDLKLDIKFQ